MNEHTETKVDTIQYLHSRLKSWVGQIALLPLEGAGVSVALQAAAVARRFWMTA